MTDMPETINVIKHPKHPPKYAQLMVLSGSEVRMDQTPYIRADLAIPRADVMELVSLIDCLIQNNPDDIISDAGHTVLQLWIHDAQKALANLKQKYGEDIAKS